MKMAAVSFAREPKATCSSWSSLEASELPSTRAKVTHHFFGKYKIKLFSAEKEVATKAVGDYFGERALIQEDVRSANVYAVGKTSCFTLGTELQIFLDFLRNQLSYLD